MRTFGLEPAARASGQPRLLVDFPLRCISCAQGDRKPSKLKAAPATGGVDRDRPALRDDGGHTAHLPLLEIRGAQRVATPAFGSLRCAMPI